MDANTLKSMTLELNGRTLYPELENCLPQYAKDLETMIRGVQKLSQNFPLDLEPAPVFSPEVK
jgi:hypothetical protein